MLILWRVPKTGSVAFILSAIGFLVLIALGRVVTDWGEKVRRAVAFRVDSIAYGFVLAIVLARFLPMTENVSCCAVPRR
jgi:hypothetical protein